MLRLTDEVETKRAVQNVWKTSIPVRNAVVLKRPSLPQKHVNSSYSHELFTNSTPHSVWDSGTTLVGGGIATVRMKFLMQLREIVR